MVVIGKVEPETGSKFWLYCALITLLQKASINNKVIFEDLILTFSSKCFYPINIPAIVADK